VFYEEKGLLQVYNIENGITKINKEFNYHQKFGNWLIEFIRYSYVEETKESFVILNCKNYTGDISPAYTIKIFKLESVDESDVVFTRIIEHPFNAKIFDKIQLYTGISKRIWFCAVWDVHKAARRVDLFLRFGIRHSSNDLWNI
jgi:hypothetical protein